MNTTGRTLFVVVLCAFCLAGCDAPAVVRPQAAPPGPRPLPAGAPIPEIKAVGWIGDESVTSEELKGHVVVIDVWAYWCGPCRVAVPEVIEAYEKYHSRGVKFLGLTSEGEERLTESQQFVDRLRIPWPNGYGAVETIRDLRVDAIPAVFVVGQNGRMVWNNFRGVGTLDGAIASALEMK